ncbi:SGNH/GDSL hydrolase family protein [Crenothrix sp.]|uniref:SGNH/GDSL hydrolase family protein n=1 Tax=Crenothrix sp. TaxID=3100433 RepID=UPI00374D7E40
MKLICFFLLSLTPLSVFAGNSAPERLFLALGDSYTIGESVAEGARWPNQLADALNRKGVKVAKPKIIAATGWRTDDLKDALSSEALKNEYDLVSLLIGVNNQYRGKSVDDYAIEFEDLLLTVIQLAKGKKENVFVVSIPDYGFTPFGESEQQDISKEIDTFNAINHVITQKHAINYIDITDISREGLKDTSLLADDGLHPSRKMYGLWTERMTMALNIR